jgi:hypothetical protein
MLKVSYELVATETDRLTIQMVEKYERREYVSRIDNEFVESCGWTLQEFEEETLRRIDTNWDLYIWN